MAAGPEAPLPNRTPLTKVAFTSENLPRTIEAIPNKAGRLPSLIQPLQRLRLVPAQMLRPVATHASSVGPTGPA
jgi:hypothetical protein